MPRPPAMPAQEKAQLVLALLAGELTLAQAARRHGVSEQAVGGWKRQFLVGGAEALAAARARTPGPEAELRAEIARLRAAIECLQTAVTQIQRQLRRGCADGCA